MPDLPDLQPLTVMDDRLRQVAAHPERVREAIALAEEALAGARAHHERALAALPQEAWALSRGEPALETVTG